MSIAAPLAAANSGSPLWYFARAAGFVSLALLTVTLCLGIVAGLRARFPGWPLLLTDGLHRQLALVLYSFIALHVVTVLLDPFTAFHPGDVLVPFGAAYRRVWTGLGVVAMELLAAVGMSVWLRPRLGHRAWKAIHLLTYVAFPITVVHGLGTGTDTSSPLVLGIYALCVAAVAGAVVARVLLSPDLSWLRPVGTAGAVAASTGIAIFAIAGPLASGWARTAGTPAQDLAKTTTPTAAVATPAGPGAAPTPVAALTALAQPFTDSLTGQVSTSTTTQFDAAGSATGPVALGWTAHEQADAAGNVTGTLSVTRADGSALCSGPLTTTQGSRLAATCIPTGATTSVTVTLDLRLSRNGSTLSGTLSVAGGG